MDNNEKKVLEDAYNAVMDNVIDVLKATLNKIKENETTDNIQLLNDCYNEGFNHAIITVEELKQRFIDRIYSAEVIDDIDNN